MGLLKYKLSDGWHVLYGGILQKVMRKDKNLSDLESISSARQNLELVGDVSTHHHDSRYQNQIDAITNDINVLKTAKQDLYDKYNNLLGRVDVLESNVATLNSQLTALTARVSTNENDIASLKGRVSTNETNIADLLSRLAAVENILNNSSTGLAKKIADLRTEIDRLPEIYVQESTPSSPAPSNKDIWIYTKSGEESISVRISNAWKKVGAYWK